MQPEPTPLDRLLGVPPFPWQRRLYARLLEGRLPRALDLPTGLGKTSVMAIWLAARAAGAPGLPRRLVYVVDRRAVVDQATRVAEGLRTWASEPVVSAALGLGRRPLPISTLRGQFVDNRDWLEDPSIPAIVVGTVDMIGSRLLFEGYACSRKMRPYHAGLLGADTLFVLDEAHLVPPFERLIEAVVQHRAPDPIPPVRLLSLSATGRDHGDGAFRLDEDDLAHPVVQQRVEATKRTTFHRLPPKAKLPDVLADHAWSLAERSAEPVRVIVFCNRRDDADKVRAALAKRARAARASLVETELFVGARRIRERVQAEARLSTLGFLAGAERPVAHAFLVATSAGEVGVDLDADHLVADVVAWERMVQRLGRVNRRGEGVAEVVLVADPDSPHADRVESLIRALPELDPGVHDASPAALGALRPTHDEAIRAASTPEPLYPPLSKPLLEAWAATSLPDHTGRPEVQPWLRGWVEDEPQTSVLWRRHLPPDPKDTSTVEELFEAAPPHASERLDTATHRVVSWLTARAARIRRRPADAAAPALDEVVAYVLDAAGTPNRPWTLADLADRDHAAGRKALFPRLAGRILAVDARLGGLSDSGLLDEAADAAPPTGDTGDPTWLRHGPSDPPPVPFRIVERSGDDANTNTASDPGWRVRLRIPLRGSADDEEVERWLVVEKWRHDAATEDDRSAGPPQPLAEHQAWAAEEADRLATALGLPEPLRRALVVAARLHDEGKRSPRWQRAFRAPDPNVVYAKTPGPVNPRLLDGYRHELGSLPYAEQDPEVRALPADLRDLVVHLVAAHHGYARPTIRTTGCDDAPPSAVEARAREVALRFYAQQERWGPWGLAWLEALLRAADQRASRRNDEREVS